MIAFAIQIVKRRFSRGKSIKGVKGDIVALLRLEIKGAGSSQLSPLIFTDIIAVS